MLSVVTAALGLAAPIEQAVAPVEAKGDHWAVIIAGSAGYGNYRHQADACHAYQIVKKAGIKPEQIILLAVDDIANNAENPFPGKLFNKPTPKGTPGVDVYEGCVIDYSGKSVTPETFSKVLTGDSEGIKSVEGSGKVLKSTKDSRVFVNFVDHGGVNLIGFPQGTMHAKELIGDLQKMSDTDMYKELVFYLEACESGSMFKTLPDDIKIYATSAANAKESSWGTYCPPDDMVDGTSLRSCLGDLYSINWMEDSDKMITSGETLETQFLAVKKLTNKSHVTEFGDSKFKNDESISNFQGKTDALRLLGKPVVDVATRPMPNATVISSRDAELASAYARFMDSGSEVAAKELVEGVTERLSSKKRFEKMALKVTGGKLTGAYGDYDLECHYKAHKAYVSKCGEWTTNTLKHSADLAEMCVKTSGDARSIVAAINEACA